MSRWTRQRGLFAMVPLSAVLAALALWSARRERFELHVALDVGRLAGVGLIEPRTVVRERLQREMDIANRDERCDGAVHLNENVIRIVLACDEAVIVRHRVAQLVDPLVGRHTRELEALRADRRRRMAALEDVLRHARELQQGAAAPRPRLTAAVTALAADLERMRMGELPQLSSVTRMMHVMPAPRQVGMSAGTVLLAALLLATAIFALIGVAREAMSSTHAA